MHNCCNFVVVLENVTKILDFMVYGFYCHKEHNLNDYARMFWLVIEP